MVLTFRHLLSAQMTGRVLLMVINRYSSFDLSSEIDVTHKNNHEQTHLFSDLLFFSTGIYAQMKDLVQYVNTLQGTDSHFGLSYGNTYPTTGMPYAMHTWSAQTGKNGEGWKYQYAVDNIRGFCQSHQCSPWMSDYAVYSFMPMVGKLVVNQEMRATKFSHDNEIAKPHYYKVMLDNGITTEMAPTTRGVHLRFLIPLPKTPIW